VRVRPRAPAPAETLGSLDCDCVQQLNGALEVISKKPCGVLFYLIQEGRGCGYVGKSRGCMLVQYHNDQITTFQAYESMGMKKASARLATRGGLARGLSARAQDYRTYTSIADICHILAVKPRFVLLTNNPDKVESMRAQVSLSRARARAPPGRR
jgi:3,4-dihydroxy 2-butanone 4-phosphate synthase/GTP cyclohydrolase II